MRTRALALGLLVFASLIAGGVTASGRASAQTPGAIQGNVPAGGGFGLVVWGGGGTDSLRTAATARGCTLASAFVTSGGDFVGFVFGAPEFVNRPFVGLFAGGNITAGTPMIIVCRAAQSQAERNRELAVAVAEGVNRARQAQNLPALRIDERLNAAADKYATFLFNAGFPTRISDPFSADIHFMDQSPQERVGREGYRSGVGETIYFRIRDAADARTIAGHVVQGWIDSPPHNTIMFGRTHPYRDVGMGCYWERGGEILVICVGNYGLGS